MFSPALEKQRQQLFARTLAGMEQRLAPAKESGQLFTALRWGMNEIERALAETPARVKDTIACRAGCGWCCSVPVDVQAHEVLLAAEHIQLHFSPTDLAAVIERTAAHRGQIARLTEDERSQFMKPCPLLSEAGSCTIYADRPEVCRSHHASNATVCAAAKHPGDFERVHIPELKARMFAVMIGMDEALEGAGFDDRAYDFGSALHEALTNSLCLARWTRRQPAFPDDCLAERPE